MSSSDGGEASVAMPTLLYDPESRWVVLPDEKSWVEFGPLGHYPVSPGDIVNDRYRLITVTGYMPRFASWLAVDLRHSASSSSASPPDTTPSSASSVSSRTMSVGQSSPSPPQTANKNNTSTPATPKYVTLKIFCGIGFNDAAYEHVIHHELKEGRQNDPEGGKTFVTIFDCFVVESPNGPHMCLATELVGPSCDVCIRQPFPLTHRIRLFRQCLEAVVYGHWHGVLHPYLIKEQFVLALPDLSNMTEEALRARLRLDPKKATYRVKTKDNSALPPGVPEFISDENPLVMVDEWGPNALYAASRSDKEGRKGTTSSGRFTCGETTAAQLKMTDFSRSEMSIDAQHMIRMPDLREDMGHLMRKDFANETEVLALLFWEFVGNLREDNTPPPSPEEDRAFVGPELIRAAWEEASDEGMRAELAKSVRAGTSLERQEEVDMFVDVLLPLHRGGRFPADMLSLPIFHHDWEDPTERYGCGRPKPPNPCAVSGVPIKADDDDDDDSNEASSTAGNDDRSDTSWVLLAARQETEEQHHTEQGKPERTSNNHRSNLSPTGKRVAEDELNCEDRDAKNQRIL